MYIYPFFFSPNPYLFKKSQPFVATLFSLSSTKMVCILRCHKKGNLMKFFIFLSVSSFTLLTFMAQGRVIHNHIDLSQVRESEVLVTRKMIGSRPPRCERKCRNCGHCKAVQVPISPLVKRSHKLYAVNSRGDDLSNYKPMCWKCQCGNSFFNP